MSNRGSVIASLPLASGLICRAPLLPCLLNRGSVRARRQSHGQSECLGRRRDDTRGEFDLSPARDSLNFQCLTPDADRLVTLIPENNLDARGWPGAPGFIDQRPANGEDGRCSVKRALGRNPLKREAVSIDLGSHEPKNGRRLRPDGREVIPEGECRSKTNQKYNGYRCPRDPSSHSPFRRATSLLARPGRRMGALRGLSVSGRGLPETFDLGSTKAGAFRKRLIALLRRFGQP